ncbi:hypothetical protein HYT04_02325 [Candidatus Kaiserbacteria bacterium]|nr:hypothetical protein [Candidatus Kaiserbacteria bacterium]
MDPRILFPIIIAGVAILGIILFKTRSVKTEEPLTIRDLPPGVRYVSHPGEEAQAQEAGKVVMQHFGTPEAIKAGGPVYGVLGYRVVAVEYEIPVHKIPKKTVGQEFPGYLLDLPELRGLTYDHFHISAQEEGLTHEEGGTPRDGTYSIHFMFISHEEELSFGLVCE